MKFPIENGEIKSRYNNFVSFIKLELYLFLHSILFVTTTTFVFVYVIGWKLIYIVDYVN